MPANHFNTHCPDWAEALLNGFSQIFLQRHPLCGLLCLLAILLTAPVLFAGALLGAVAGLLTAQRRNYAKADRQAGLFSYNGILLGLLLSLYFPWSPMLPPLILAAGGLSAMVTQQWLKHVYSSRSIPAYTSPFVAMSWVSAAVRRTVGANGAYRDEHVEPARRRTAWFGPGDVPPSSTGRRIDRDRFADRRSPGVWLGTAGLGDRPRFQPAAPRNQRCALLGLGSYNAVLAALAFSSQRQQPWLPLLGIVLALLVTPLFAAIGLATLTAPFILAGWLIRAGIQMLGKTPVEHAPCAHGENQPRLR
jgi:urea transporter